MVFISTSKDSKDLSLTVYQNNFGVVKEKRALNLGKGEDTILYLDVSRYIETNSIIVDNIEVYEINFNYDLITREKLLESYLGKEICFYDYDSNKKVTGTLLGFGRGYIIEDSKSKEVSLSERGQVILPELPKGFVLQPTLVLKVLPTKAKIFGLSYITSGLNWKASYTIELSKKTLNLTCWAQITNTSGIDYKNTRLSLVSGDIKKVQDRMLTPYMDGGFMLKAAPVSQTVAPQTLGEYYLYNYEVPTSISDDSSKQIKLLSGSDISYVKYYTNPSSGDLLATVIEFYNKKENNLGFPLPMGIAKVYEGNYNDRTLEFIGEDYLDSTPVGEKVTLNLGEPFDIVYEKNLLDYKKLDDHEEYEYEIIIKNRSREAAPFKITHYISGDWKIISSTDEFKKKDANTIEFEFIMPPLSEKRIVFRYAVGTK